jgi:hypothetical protein
MGLRRAHHALQVAVQKNWQARFVLSTGRDIAERPRSQGNCLAGVL